MYKQTHKKEYCKQIYEIIHPYVNMDFETFENETSIEFTELSVPLLTRNLINDPIKSYVFQNIPEIKQCLEEDYKDTYIFAFLQLDIDFISLIEITQLRQFLENFYNQNKEFLTHLTFFTVIYFMITNKFFKFSETDLKHFSFCSWYDKKIDEIKININFFNSESYYMVLSDLKLSGIFGDPVEFCRSNILKYATWIIKCTKKYSCST